MAKNLSSLTIIQPASDPNIAESGTFTFEVQPGFSGSGTVTAYDLDLQFDQGTGSWTNITTSGGLTSSDTTYWASTQQETNFSITL